MNRLSKHVLVPLCLAVALVAGCTTQGAQSNPSSSPAATPSATPAPPPPGVIKDSGFGKRDTYVWVTSIVHNNTEAVGQFVTVHFDLADKAGNLIASADQTETFDRPNGDIAVGTQVEVSKKAKIASVTTTLVVDETSAESVDAFPAIVASKRSVGMKWGAPSARFVLRNPMSKPLSDPRVAIVCYSKTNRIIGGGVDYPELMPAKQNIVVEASVMTNGKPHHCAAYVGAPSDWEGLDEDTTTEDSGAPSTGPDDASTAGAVEALQHWFDQFNAADWLGHYATLVAAQKAVITEQEYVACRQGDEKQPLTWIKGLGAKPEAGHQIPGTSVKQDSIVVKARIKVAGMATGIDAHMYLEDGAWHWEMSKGNIKNCFG